MIIRDIRRPRPKRWGALGNKSIPRHGFEQQWPPTNKDDDDNNHNNNKKNNKNKHKNATKKCVTSCGIKRTSYCALHLRARAEHMNAHTTIHNAYGIASVRSSAIQLRRLPTSGLPHERPRATRALGAVPNRRPSDPAPKNSSESCLDGIRVVHRRLHEHSPTSPFWGYLRSEKNALLTHFSDNFLAFRKQQIAVNYNIFAF